MTIPTDTEVRAYLEGYGVTEAILSKAWIEKRRDAFIIPAIKKIIGYDFINGETKTEYVSGNGQSILMLSCRPVLALVSITYVNAVNQSINPINATVTDDKQGILVARSVTGDGSYAPALFRKGSKNIKVEYTVPAANEELEELILLFMAKAALRQIASRTGGGDLSTQAFSRSFGALGKYTHIIKAINRDAAVILSHYTTGVVAP